jgi:hypothetical protein
MSDISQLERRGEWGKKLSISFHYLAQGEGQGRWLRSLPLGSSHTSERLVLTLV